MARAVAQTIDRRRRLLVEAGTGVGKSLAYLVPVALHAEATGSRAVVATATITLQEQLVHADFPQLVPALGRPPTVALLKGRQNYISLRRWQRFLGRPRATRHGADLERVRFTLKILVWLALTRTGDRAELRLTSSEEALWREIESAADDCLGSGCFNWRDNACHMVRARAHATAADIVITNHALLLADAESEGRVLGPHSVLVIDEAHRLEESATQQWGRSLEAADVAHVTNRLPDLAVGSSAAEAVSVARDAAGRFFGDLKGFVGEHLGADQPANATVGLSEDLRGGYQFVVARRSAELAVAALRGAVACLRADFGNAGAPHGDSAEADGVGAEVELAAVALLSAAETLDRVVLTPVEGHVRWVALRAEQAHVHEAPIEIGDRMRALVERTDASVLTSATLSVGGSFDFVRHRLGLGGNVEELVVASPFDYLAQALTVLPAGIPAHDDPGVDAALLSVVGDIVRRLQGRTLVLFTGYGPLRRLHGALQRSLSGSGIAVLGQGLDGTRRQILASFLANRRSVLLGTNTFWEGIDVPGDALSCVVIAKLPFPVPTDPLVQARTARLRDPFRDHALPIAVLRLRQGFGRLIRRTDDRGAVVLCDPRLASRDYGQAFLDALPPATVTRPPLAMVGEIVEAFVGGGALPRLDV